VDVAGQAPNQPSAPGEHGDTNHDDNRAHGQQQEANGAIVHFRRL